MRLYSERDSRAAETAESSSDSRGLLASLDVCESILKTTHETKELVQSVGVLAVEIKGDKDEVARLRQEAAGQQMGLFLMSQIFQNPESLEKLMPGLAKMAEFGAAQKKIDEQAARRGARRAERENTADEPFLSHSR